MQASKKIADDLRALAMDIETGKVSVLSFDRSIEVVELPPEHGYARYLPGDRHSWAIEFERHDA